MYIIKNLSRSYIFDELYGISNILKLYNVYFETSNNRIYVFYKNTQYKINKISMCSDGERYIVLHTKFLIKNNVLLFSDFLKNTENKETIRLKKLEKFLNLI